MIPAKTWNQRTPRLSHSRTEEVTCWTRLQTRSCFSFPGKLCSRSDSAAAECGTEIHPSARETLFPPQETTSRFSERHSGLRYRMPAGKAPRRDLLFQAAIGCIVRPDPSATKPAHANHRLPAAPVALARQALACQGQDREYASKSVSSLKPFS